MRFAKVNVDYEYELFKEEINEQFTHPYQNGHSLDFLFLLINKDKNIGLSTTNSFENDYFEYLESLDIFIPEIIQSELGFNWIGALSESQIKVEKKLNSKEFSYDLINKLKLHKMPFKIVISNNEVRDFISMHPNISEWILKPVYLKAGYDLKVIKHGDLSELFINSKYVIEPKFNRILDLVCYYDYKDQSSFYYIQDIDKSFSYRGGYIFENESNFKNYLKDLNMNDAFSDQVKNFQLIIDYLEDNFELNQPLSIDSFIYENQESQHTHPCCDINYRVNFGQFAKELVAFLPENGVGKFIFIRHELDKSLREVFKYQNDTKCGIIFLSDFKHKDKMILITDKNLNLLKRRITKFLSVINYKKR